MHNPHNPHNPKKNAVQIAYDRFRLDQGSKQLNALYRAIQEQALNVIWNLLKENRPDLAANVAGNALTRLPRFRKECRFSTWTHQIAHNLCVSHLRKIREHATDPVEFDAITVPNCANQVEAKRLLEQLSLRLDPDEQRLLRFYQEGLTSREIAQETGYSIKTVERLWLHLRQKMRRLCQSAPARKQI